MAWLPCAAGRPRTSWRRCSPRCPTARLPRAIGTSSGGAHDSPPSPVTCRGDVVKSAVHSGRRCPQIVPWACGADRCRQGWPYVGQTARFRREPVCSRNWTCRANGRTTNSSQVTTDWITKPAQYAAAGIPAYWRVETPPQVSLTAYTLPTGGSVYAEVGTGTAGQAAHLEAPFRVEVANRRAHAASLGQPRSARETPSARTIRRSTGSDTPTTLW
jgi:hypothetical protein